jgi:hypothetical protein
MDTIEDVRGATVDGVKVDLASGMLRMVMHALTDQEELHWEVFLRGISSLRVERRQIERWTGVTVGDVQISTQGDRTTLELTLGDASTGSLAVECGEVEVVPMGRVELS